ncbi:MAG: DUF533 domain-containing protein [Alphaproteobacteria bacterium]|nr:DUF533 domain-containing protein [Alphaproteobacteria bacterium]
MDAPKLLDRFLNSGVATGVIAGALGSSLLRRGGLGGIARIGGLALVGTLAYQAYQRYQQQQGQLPPEQRQSGFRAAAGGILSNLPGVNDLLTGSSAQTPPPGSGFASPDAPAGHQNQLGTAVLTAMIAAAKADGEVDQSESSRIFGEMEQEGLTPEEKSFVLSELAKPLDVDDVAKLATSREVAAQLYAASALVVDAANDKERDYLSRLAQRMNLDQAFVDELNKQIGQR